MRSGSQWEREPQPSFGVPLRVASLDLENFIESRGQGYPKAGL